MGDRTLDYIALGVLCFVVLTIIYGVIYIHDIPYEIAKKRNHPHQDAIHTAGWVSLFLMHTIWPFLWIWATLYKPNEGWGIGGKPSSGGADPGSTSLHDQLQQLQQRLEVVEAREKKSNTLFKKHIKSLHQKLEQITDQQLEQEG